MCLCVVLVVVVSPKNGRFIVQLSVVLRSVILLNGILLSVILPSIILLNVIFLSVALPVCCSSDYCGTQKWHIHRFHFDDEKNVFISVGGFNKNRQIRLNSKSRCQCYKTFHSCNLIMFFYCL